MEQDCRVRDEEKCEVVQERECSVVTKQQCDTVTEQMCMTENMQVCETVNDQMCTANEVFIPSSSEFWSYNKSNGRSVVQSTSSNVQHLTASNVPHLHHHPHGHPPLHPLAGPHHLHHRTINKVPILAASLMSREYPGLCQSPITEVVSRVGTPLRVGVFREVDRAQSTSLESAHLMSDHRKMSSKTLFWLRASFREILETHWMAEGVLREVEWRDRHFLAPFIFQQNPTANHFYHPALASEP